MLKYIFVAVLALAAVVKSFPNGFSENEQQAVEASVISEKSALDLFQQFQADKKMAFEFPLDGCYARATAMARIAEDNKIKVAKIYVEGILRVRNASKEYPEILWGYHVAPIVGVKKEDGTVVDMVMDPSLFEKPVPVSTWLDRMKGAGVPEAVIDKVYYGSRYQLFPRSVEPNKNNWRRVDLKKTKMVLETYSDFVENHIKKSSKNEKQNQQSIQQGAQ
ncbi:MAG: protein-glutamine glutaminase family protein [Bdellovibrio sp.]